MTPFIEKTERFVKKQLENIDSSHDYLHIARVRLLALQFAKSCASCRPDEPVEGNVSHPPRDSCTYFVDKDYNLIVEKSIQRFNQDPFELDLEMIEMAALLHDVGDFKYASVTPSDSNQCDILRSFLVDELQYPNANEILFIIDHLSYRDELAEPEYLKDRLAKVQSMKEFATLMSLAIVQDADRIDAIGAIGKERFFLNFRSSFM